MINKLYNFLFPDYGILFMKSIFIQEHDILPINVLKYDYIIVERSYKYNSTLDDNYTLLVPNKNYCSNNKNIIIYVNNKLLKKLPDTIKFITYDNILKEPCCYILFKSKKELASFKLKY